MAFKRITENDMLGKGNVGKPDTPGVSTSEMQRIMDELPREVIAPAFNELSGQLEADTASADIGANAPDGITPDPAPAENSPAKLQSVLQGIVNKITDHIADQVKHVTSEERTSWNNASNDRHAHDNKSILDGITSSLVGNWNAAFAHVSDAVRHITENERTNWNDKYTKSETDKAINERVVEIGSSDMTKAVYDPETRNLPYIPKIDAEVLTLGKNVVLSGAPVSIAYAGENRIASITAYGETPQGGTTEAPVALTGISSVTVNDDVTELPIPRPLRRVGDVKDKCVTRQDYESAEKLVVTYNVGFVELDGTEVWARYARISTVGGNFYEMPIPKKPKASNVQVTGTLSSHLTCDNAYTKKVDCVWAFANTQGAVSTLRIGFSDDSIDTAEKVNAYLAAQKAAGTPVQVAYQLAAPEVYATDPVDFDNTAGPLTVMTGGEVEVRMTELVGSRSPELTAKMDRAVYAQVGNPNLGHNTNFLIPVNQQGLSSYIAKNGSALCIDRWTLGSGGTYDVAARTLSAASYANRACGLWQANHLGEHWLEIGSTITFSAYINGKYHSGTMTVLNRDSYSSFSAVPAGYTCDDFEVVCCTYAGNPLLYNLGIYAKKQLVINWVKWERGSAATPYALKPFPDELAMCQRYFNAIAIEVAPAYFLDGSIHYFPASLFPARMRVVPTIEIISAGVGNVGAVAASAVTVAMDVNGIREIIVNAGTSAYDAYNKLTLDMRISANY